MLNRNQIKIIHSLKIKKFRKEHKLFVAEGSKTVSELFSSSYNIRWLIATKTWLQENNYLINRKNINREGVYEAEESEMKKISFLTTPQDVIAVAEIPEENFNIRSINNLALALDDIQDPGNLGTIIRIADWFGINHILCSEGCVDLYNPKVIQAAMGSFTRVRLIYTNLKDVLEKAANSNLPVFGAFLDGENIYAMKKEPKGIIVMGNEGKGISAEIEELINKKITIPRFGGAESLNVSVATAVICSEFRRIDN
jgi:RNA methyltransferase, TrmH family